jgi:hypothetical protein
MLTTVRGTYENGQIIWREKPPVQERTEVIVTFLEENGNLPDRKKPNRKAGSMKGQIKLADDFNEPLDDLKDYM